MKITYGNLTISTKYTYLVFILLLFLTDYLYFDLITGGEPSPLPTPEKYLAVIAVAVSILLFGLFTPFIQYWMMIAYLYFFALVVESFFVYGSFLVYPHVFSKIMCLFLVFMAGMFFSKPEPQQLRNIAYFIVVGFFLNILLYKREYLTLGAFVQTERAIQAGSTYLIMLPCIYFFNKYLVKERPLHLVLFFVMLGFILFLQHRTVWVCTTISLVVSVLFVYYKSPVRPSVTARLSLVVFPAMVGMAIFLFVLSERPEVITQFFNRVSDIQNYESQGTGGWRYQQFQSYMPFVEQNPIFGMRFAGFELPIQFYSEDADIAYFEDGTGHHFHSFYLDKLFYFGLFGFIIISVPSIYIIIKYLRLKSLSPEQITLLVFVVSGFAYGLSYNWPFYYYGIIGMALAFTEYEPNAEETDEEPELTAQQKKQLNEKKTVSNYSEILT
ncbi:O-antigen ligase family protein [Pontibacter vulgaris]|uniref:O-antigen ligase family protein n=1 Tax=Pontibacter vulgaris TaxID=2905679 RepID=UPI001FA6E199|nr:O-antigen ligase family protein [Pontibacter vulgaris]